MRTNKPASGGTGQGDSREVVRRGRQGEGEPFEKPRLVPLNLVTSYPVRWSRFQVLRDFLQNFFDSVPGEEFARRVKVRTSGRSAEVVAEGVTFSHEWLVHIGASSKTADTEGAFAGYFGEGFKVAALCAKRDFGWQVAAGSGSWRLEVTTAPLLLDGVPMQTLAYRVESDRSPRPAAWLRLDGLDESDRRLLETSVLWSFYYPENPLLGERVWSDHRTAVWTRSAVSIPRSYPGSTGDRGILFVGRQARGTHELPFVVAGHDLRDRDRERTAFYDFQVIDALADLAWRLPGKAAAALLAWASRHWSDCRSRRYECGTWEPVVRALAERVGSESRTAARWRARFPNLLVLERLGRGSMSARNRRAEARAWMRSSARDWRLVQSGFRVLGYPSLEEACEADGGYLRPVEPLPEDRRRVELLLAFVRHHLLDLIPLARLPPVTLVESKRAGWGGSALCLPLRRGPVSLRGRRIRYDLGEISLSIEALRSPSPNRVLASLLHELCHAFGTDQSAAFGAALTDVLERVAGRAGALESLAAGWSTPATSGR